MSSLFIRLQEAWLRLAAGEQGQGMVEYAFILVLVVLVLIVSVAVLGQKTSNMYSNVSNAMPS